MRAEVKKLPFSIYGNTYHLKVETKIAERMKVWLAVLEERKQVFKAKHPTLEEKHYENMSLIWLLGEISEFETGNFELKKKIDFYESEEKDLIKEIEKQTQN